MIEEFEVMGQTKFDRINGVYYTDYRFMDQRSKRNRAFAKTRDEELAPPADRNVFDRPPEDEDDVDAADFQPHEFDVLKLSLEWGSEPNEFEDDLIRVPSLDSEMKWSQQNRLVTVPNMSQSSLARAATGGEASIQGAQLSILEELKRMTNRQTVSEIKPEDWISESDITDNDVICERGGKSNRHAGTKRYRGIVEKFKPVYQSLTAKIEKTNLSRKIIAQIQDNHGRFLKRDEQTGQFYVLCKVETTKKVSQALREKKVLKWTDDAL